MVLFFHGSRHIVGVYDLFVALWSVCRDVARDDADESPPNGPRTRPFPSLEYPTQDNGFTPLSFLRTDTSGRTGNLLFRSGSSVAVFHLDAPEPDIPACLSLYNI